MYTATTITIIANICVNPLFGTLLAYLSPIYPPRTPPIMNNTDIIMLRSPLMAYLAAVTTPNVPIGNRDVPTA